MPYNIISRAIEAEIMPYCAEQGIEIISSMTLQQGILAGIYKTADDVPPHQAHSRHFLQERGKGVSRHYEAGAEDEVFQTVALLRELSAELGVSAAQLSVAWVWRILVLPPPLSDRGTKRNWTKISGRRN